MRLSNVDALWAAGLVSLLVSFLLVGFLVRVSGRLGVYALPGARQSHIGVTATGGGLGMITAMCLVSWSFAAVYDMDRAWINWVLPGALALSAVGWLDDRTPLSPLFRLFIQLVVSFGLLVLLRNTDLEWTWSVLLLTGVVMVWLMNMYNFMDGSHGMAGFEGVFASAVIAVLSLESGRPDLALAASITAACCAGFLPWNFPRPRIFMGDAGSVPLGFILAALLLLALKESALSLPVAILVLSVFLIDSGWTLLRRVIRGERWYTPHKQHVYQKLIAHGWPHSKVLMLYQAINIGVVVPAIVLAKMYPEHAWLIVVIVALTMSLGWHAASLRWEVRT